MADNLSRTSAPAFALADHAVIDLEGPEAVAFAHAQFANDVVALPVGQWQWNAWLTPKGRVIALFLLARVAEERVALVLPDYPAAAFATALQRFVFRRKLKVTVADGMQVVGRFAPPVHAEGARIGRVDEVVELDVGGEQGPRTLLLTGAPGIAVDEAMTLAWQHYDLRHGVPRLPEAQREQWTPQQLSLERLPAFSVKKGCYPGQEIVARTHFLGKAKRGLALLESPVALEAGAMVSDGARDIGELVCALPAPSPVALAVLPLERDAASLSVGGQAVTEQALLTGLAR